MKIKKQAAKTNPGSPQERNMHDIKTVKEASQDFAADFAALRDDISKLTRCVSELVRDKASTTTSTVMDAVDDTRQRLSDRAAETQNQLRGAGSDIEAMIERKVAVLAALSAGLLIGIMSGARK